MPRRPKYEAEVLIGGQFMPFKKMVRFINRLTGMSEGRAYQERGGSGRLFVDKGERTPLLRFSRGKK